MYLNMRNGNVAIELVTPSEKTAGGIYIPGTATQKALRYGKIVAAGPGELVQGQFVDPKLEKGQEVLFDITRSEAITIDGTDIYICNMVDVIATVSAKHLSVVPSRK